MPFDTIIRGGTVVTASDTFASDVGIRDGKIVALGNLPDDDLVVRRHGCRRTHTPGAIIHGESLQVARGELALGSEGA